MRAATMRSGSAIGVAKSQNGDFKNREQTSIEILSNPTVGRAVRSLRAVACTPSRDMHGSHGNTSPTCDGQKSDSQPGEYC